MYGIQLQRHTLSLVLQPGFQKGRDIKASEGKRQGAFNGHKMYFHKF
jgi:hypothetical protein